MEPLQGKAHGRRGRRIPMRLPLMIHWREPQGAWREVPAQTKVLSKHGCLISCPARIKLSDEIMVWWLEKMHYTEARVVFRKVSADEAVEIAVAFLGTDDFWGMDFSSRIEPERQDASVAAAAL